MSGLLRQVFSGLSGYLSAKSRLTSPPTLASGELHDIPLKDTSGPMENFPLERLLFAVEGMSDGLYWGIPSGEAWWSETFRELIGYSKDELPASYESWVSLLHPDDRNDVLKSLEDHFEKGGSYDIEYRLRTKNQGYRWVLDRGASQMGKDGRPSLTGGSIQDITERRQAEEALHRAKQIVTSSTDLLAMLDRDLRYLSVNEAYAKASEKTPEEIIGQTPCEIFGQEFFEAVIESNAQRCLAGERVQYQAWLVYPIYGRRYMDVSYSPYFDANEEVNGFVVALHDITDLKLAQEEQWESERRFHDLYDNAPDMFASIDAATGAIVECNNTLVEAIGYSREEIIGFHISKLYHPDSESARQKVFQAFVEGGEVHDVELQLQRKDGGTIDVSLSISAIRDNEGKVVRSRSVWRDITQRKRTENQLRLTQFSIDHNSNATYHIKSDASICYVNEAACQTLGYTRTELLAMTVPDIDPDFPEEAWPAHWRDMKEAGSLTFESRHKTQDGRVFPVEIQSNFLVYEGEEYIWAFARDLSEKKAVETELRKLTEYLDAILLNLPAGLAIMEVPDFRFFRINKALAAINGLSVEEHLGRPLAEVLPDAAPDIVPGLRRVVETGVPSPQREFSTRLPKDPQKVRHFFDTFFPIVGENGKPRAVGAVVVDITERKEIEEGLRLYAEIIEHMAEGVNLIRQDNGVIVYANPRFEELFGYAPGELIGQHVTILNASGRRSPEEMVEDIIQAVQERGFWSGEIHNVKKDGTEFWTHANITTFEHSEYGEVWLSVQQDITERIQATQTLRESEQRMRDIFDSMIIFVALFTPEGVLIDLNRASLEVGGFSREDVIGKPFWDTYGWDYSKEVQEQLREALLRAAAGETVRYDVPIRASDSEEGEPVLITIDATFAPLFDAKGNVVQIVGSAVDITDRVKAEEERLRLEEQMQQAQKLESLGVLAGGIAHDFNNLLAAILGNADLALNELSPTSRARSYVNDIVASSERAADLCRQMLAYSGRGRFVLESLNLNAIVQEMGQLLKTSIGKKISLEYDLMRDLPQVEGDATQISQIAMNLVINASEAIGEDPGTIGITTGLRNCESDFLASTWLDDSLRSGEYVYFEFADTGCGMNSEDLEKVFDPFFTTKFTGRGLGLAAVLGIVRGHQGAIKVESTRGEGTRFTVFLPSSGTSEPLADAKLPVSASTLHQGTVLLVDDEPFVRKAATSMLRKAGYSVLTAADGHEALKVYKEHSSSVICVLLDLTMPRMDGEETFDELRQLGCYVPILLCSGFDSEETAERFKGKDVAGFLHKPYSMKELLGKLTAVLET